MNDMLFAFIKSKPADIESINNHLNPHNTINHVHYKTFYGSITHIDDDVDLIF